ncbi:germin-like protein 9-3 [Magnolia sinica]|uniref:germin-like protein 9-3 n=1 Tax=Magnolia sinica TaxID=86752 RepID=UPI0026585366|nr:germin-like protein 9-3 [Magnolia sinica]
MAFHTLKHGSFLVVLILAIAQTSKAGDPDIISDFLIPTNLTIVDNNFFTYTGFRVLVDADPPTTFKVTKASMAEFPALNGQSVSFAVLQYPSGSVNPPHTHPRSAELLLLLQGSLEVGFVDTANKLYTQTLQVGDMFVFPKGLVHYQYNSDGKDPALAISGFGSANAGTVSVPGTVFATGIDNVILAKSFKTDDATVQKIEAGIAPKA